MKLIPSLLIGLFFVALIVDCFFILYNMDSYRFITKPMLVPILYVFMALQTGDTTHKRSKLLISFSLLFCFAGDYLLLNQDDKTYFTLGVTCFLLAQICYGIFFYRLKPFSGKRIIAIIVLSLFIVGYLAVLLSSLWKNISGMGFEVPIVTYSLVIGFMVLTALYTAAGKRIRKLAWQNFVPGAILFLTSDTLLAVDKFYLYGDKGFQTSTHLLFSIIVMVTYAFAQLLIVYGASRIMKK